MRIFISSIFFWCSIIYINAEKDPYEVLGISRKANSQTIKKQYRLMAQKYHPDKNKGSEEAQDKMVEINAAYDLLSDPEKKKHYDRWGHAEAPRQQHQRNQFHDPFAFNYGYMRQKYNKYYSQHSWPDSVSAKLTGDNYNHITYASTGDSDELIVWLIFVFSGSRCHLCEKMKPTWEKAAKQLKGFVKTGKIQSDYEISLTRQLGIRQVPTIFSLTIENGRSERMWARNRKLSNSKAYIEFIGQSFERYTKVQVLSGSTDVVAGKLKHLSDSNDDKVKAIYLTRRTKPHILYKRLAHEFRKNIVFAHICVDHVDIEKLFPKSLELSKSNAPMLIIRKESGTRDQVIDSVHISNNLADMTKILKSHIYMRLPKLTINNFYELCYRGVRGKGARKQEDTHDSRKRKPTRACLIIFAKTKKKAQKIASPLLKSTSPLRSALETYVQLGWIDPRQHPEFVSFFVKSSIDNNNVGEKPRTSSRPIIIFIKMKNSQFLSYYKSSPMSLHEWAVDILEENKPFIDGYEYGGIPFLDPETTWIPDISEMSIEDLSFYIKRILKTFNEYSMVIVMIISFLFLSLSRGVM